jgi:hypothetical protein
METKHYIALIVLVALGSGSVLISTFSQRLRDFMFFCMVAGAVMAERFDVNFLGEYWYRGTSRGIGVSLIDVAGFGILVATLVAPRYPRRRWFLPAGFFVYLVYFVYCIFSVAHAWDWHYGTWELANIPRAMLIALATASFVRSRRELSLLVAGLAVGACLQGLFAVKQRVIGGMFRPAGTLDHANSMSMYLCLITPVLLASAFSDLHNYLRWLSLIGCADVCIRFIM